MPNFYSLNIPKARIARVTLLFRGCNKISHLGTLITKWHFITPGPSLRNVTFRRILALAIDWFSAILITQLIPNSGDYGTRTNSLFTLVIFSAQIITLVTLTGSSFGHRFLGLRVLSNKNQRNPNLFQSILRTFFIILVFPPLLTDKDGIGLHDRLAKTQIVRI